jgi:glycerophosphoryl diester phosphodiesterase
MSDVHRVVGAAVAAALLAALPALGGCAGADLRLINGVTRVIAHRGGTGPDGTVAGCLRSLEAGVVFLELDVRLTRDGRAVILHDPTVDRTTDGAGVVADMTFEQLRRLDAGVRYRDPADPARSFAGQRVPTPAEVLRAVGERGVVLLELKVPTAAEAVIEEIRAEDAFHRAVVRTADEATLARIKQLEPRVMTGTMGPLPPPAEMDAFVAALAERKVSAITPRNPERVTRESVARLHRAGIAVWGSNSNDPAVWEGLIAAGVDGIITDCPAELSARLK